MRGHRGRWGPSAALLVLLILLAGCGPQPGSAGAGGGTAGERTGPAASPEPPAGAGSAPPAGRASDPPPDAAATAHLDPCPEAPAAEAVPGGLPALELDCLGSGPAVTLSGLRGRPTVVNVWASWCSPCAREMPILERAHRRVGEQVAFLGIDLLDRPDAAARASRDFGMTFPSVQDPDGLLRAELGLPGPPATLLVDADGRIVHKEYGEISSAAQLDGLLRTHLGVEG